MTVSGFFRILIAALVALASIAVIMIYAYSSTSGGESKGES